jgi:hypothetical protein
MSDKKEGILKFLFGKKDTKAAPAVKAPEKAASAPEAVNPLNPRAVLAKREKDAGLACGGKVRKMAAGGKVRGQGCATRTKSCKMK